MVPSSVKEVGCAATLTLTRATSELQPRRAGRLPQARCPVKGARWQECALSAGFIDGGQGRAPDSGPGMGPALGLGEGHIGMSAGQNSSNLRSVHLPLSLILNPKEGYRMLLS